MKKAPVWQPLVKSTTAPGAKDLASASTPGWKGSESPDATRTEWRSSAAACVTALSAAKSAAEA